jgi:pilus assembly protein Flp/PilA
MLKLISTIHAYAKCEKGATAIEYGLIAAGIAVGISAVVFTFGDTLTAMFQSASDDIAGAGS